MSGLPKLPGMSFNDPTLSRFHRCQTFNMCNGYKLPKTNYVGIGGRELACNSVRHIPSRDVTPFDPSLIYGRTRTKALPQFVPHFALYDKKCLTFQAFFKQTVVESPLEHYRVRKVNIIYFLEDDTITVMEPKTINSGIDQGRLIKRAKIPKNTGGDFYHWKDLDVGKDLAFYGIVFHTVKCDAFTREFMLSQGLIMGPDEEMPADPYTESRQLNVKSLVSKTPPADDKLRRFLEYDGKILKFKAIWDDRDSEYGELRKYELLYFLSEDTISVKELKESNAGKDPYPVLLKKMKLPKIYTDLPKTFPSIYMELSESEVGEYYQPKDLLVGETIFVLGRKMLLYDCDQFTRDFYKKVLCIDQKAAMDVSVPTKAPPPRVVPPHDGIGSLEDSLQNTLTFLPKQPRKDVIRQILNANKYLRYEMVMDAVHPEDEIRRFVLQYSLSDCTCKIYEPPLRNSGIIGGKYLKSTLLVKPGSDPLNPTYYSPVDFYIGAMITVFEQRFRIVGADLYVYRYMQANADKFPCEVIENMRNFMFNKGYLKDDVEEQLEKNLDKEKKIARDSVGKNLQFIKSEMDKCLDNIGIGGSDPEYEQEKLSQIRNEYEESLKHTYKVPPYGIQEVNKTCKYPIFVGDVKKRECREQEIEDGTGYTPKHIETEAERTQRHYAEVLQKQQELCRKYDGKYLECGDFPLGNKTVDEGHCFEGQKPKPIMTAPPDLPPDACNVKQVKFVGEMDRCDQDRYDLCNLKMPRTTCDCTDYAKCNN